MRILLFIFISSSLFAWTYEPDGSKGCAYFDMVNVSSERDPLVTIQTSRTSNQYMWKDDGNLYYMYYRGTDGSIYNYPTFEPKLTCIQKPCEPTPPPENKQSITVFSGSDASNECLSASSNLYYTDSNGQLYSNLSCYTDNCSASLEPDYTLYGVPAVTPTCENGQILDSNTNSCVCPSQTTLLDGSCVPDNDGDSVPDSIDNDDDNDGIPDEYDDEPFTPVQNTYEDCQQLIRDKAVPCNTDYFDLNVNCTYTQNNIPYLTQNSCTPKPDIANPCVVKWEQFKLTCIVPNTPNYLSCNHNGVTVINYDFECDQTGATPDTPIPTDCRLSQNQVWSEQLQNCVCDVGYTMNQYGSCWKDLEDNATAEQIKEDEKKQEEAFLDGQADKDSVDKTNQIADNTTAQTKSLSNIENTLSGVRSDLNTTNDILSNIAKNLRGLESDESTSEDGGISDALSEAENLLQQRTDFFTTLKGQYEQAFTNLNNQWDSIQTQFSSTEAYFNQTRSFSFSSGRTDCFSGSFLGRSFTLDLCKYLSMIAPFVYLILTVSFSVITFVFVSKNIFKGFD
jgi:hypothetical protein